MTIGWSLLNKACLDAYMGEDWVLDLIVRSQQEGDEALRGQQWLLDQPAKRLAAAGMYGDLVRGEGGRRRVLDVGGGLSALTRVLARAHDYRLVECFAHETPDRVEALLREMPDILVGDDWWTVSLDDEYDVIVANDIFPNVDQRLEAFLERALPRCRFLRLTATIYPQARFYRVKREDAEERMCMVAWDQRMLGLAMAQYAGRLGLASPPRWDAFGPSLYSNGRQVISFCLRGDL